MLILLLCERYLLTRMALYELAKGGAHEKMQHP